jgi:hypothetical protein
MSSYQEKCSGLLHAYWCLGPYEEAGRACNGKLILLKKIIPSKCSGLLHAYRCLGLYEASGRACEGKLILYIKKKFMIVIL